MIQEMKLYRTSIKEAKILFHISGYKNSCQFEWLFRAIYNSKDIFIIHIDKKSSKYIHDAYRAIVGDKSNVFFLPSISVTWGGCGLIDAELAAIRFALQIDQMWTHLVNLSAQDYPLIAMEDLRKKLSDSWPFNFVLCNDIRRVHWRIRKRALFRYVEYDSRRIFTPIPKIRPKGVKIGWVGPWWHILTREFCCWLISSAKADLYLNFLRNAGMPDEMLIQNIIMDSPFKREMQSCCKHEIIWRRPGEPRASSARPRVMTIRDLPHLENSTAYFARKFDCEIDQQILLALASRHEFDMPSSSI